MNSKNDSHRDWYAYQEEVAGHFRSIGTESETNVTLAGVRTEHDIDVVVKSKHAGFEVLWIVECKLWKTAITKFHVLGLRQIVVDVGADRGILLAESGFQSGAVEAATLTNVHLTSLAQARETATAELAAMKLADLNDRVEQCQERYWAIPKKRRIEEGLRPEAPAVGYSGAVIISLCEDALRKAFRGVYPFELDFMLRSAVATAPSRVRSSGELIDFLEAVVAELESRLNACTD